MTIAGAIMTYRAYFRGEDDAFRRDTGLADRRPFSRWHPFTSKEQAKAEDRKAFRYGLLSFVVGTLIWAYGDLLLAPKKEPTQFRGRMTACQQRSAGVEPGRPKTNHQID